MHITKNIVESTFDTLMAAKGQRERFASNSCGPKEDINVRLELHPVIQPNWTKKLLVASWTLGTKEKEKLLSFFHELQILAGYYSNIRRLANMNERFKIQRELHEDARLPC